MEGAAYYYETLLDYVHLNPARAGLVRPLREESLLDYPWSSVAGGYALPARRRPTWLDAEAGLEAFGFADTTAGRRRFVERLDQRAREEAGKRAGLPPVSPEEDGRRSHLRRGWYWGSQAFMEKLQRIGGGVLGAARHRHPRRSQEHRAHGEAQAQRLLREGLSRLGWTAAHLRATHGSESNKVALAAEIWQNTTVSQECIAKYLCMRNAKNVSQHSASPAAMLRMKRQPSCQESTPDPYVPSEF